jgi:hypothetical protein
MHDAARSFTTTEMVSRSPSFGLECHEVEEEHSERWAILGYRLSQNWREKTTLKLDAYLTANDSMLSKVTKHYLENS